MYQNFSSKSKVWIYQSSRPFTESEIDTLNNNLSAFTKQWTAHNNQLHAAGKVLEDRFILLMVDETHAGASGCSIDKSVHFIQSIEKELNIELFNRMLVNYKTGDKIITTELSGLNELHTSGEIQDDTLFYNPLVQTKKELDEIFITPLHNSWVKQFV
ncbi:MAG: ABC transporter ATPase [Fimbriimonadaceae bacterium]|nr:ABC transporter ATPase [Chitinophagales bacterium]